jgi:hypothetical protein
LPTSAVDAVNPAFLRTQQQLIRPFRFRYWVRLAVVGLLSGEIGSGGGCNFSSFNYPGRHHPRGSGGVIHAAWSSQASQLMQHPSLSAGGITFLIVATLGFFVLLLYIGSVMRFILFESVILKECHIREGWRRHRRHGLQLFWWQILLMLASLASFIFVLGIPLAGAWTLGWFTAPRDHILALVLGGSVLLMVFFGFVLTLAVVHVMTKDFVVPQMALENIRAIEAWRRLWLGIKNEKVGYLSYLGMKIVLAIGAGVLLGVIALIALLMLLLPLGGIGAIAVIGGAAAGLTWNLYTITLAAVAACILFAVILFVTSFISVPATVFFPCYSIYFFASRYPPLAALLGSPVTPPAAGGSLPHVPAPSS